MAKDGHVHILEAAEGVYGTAISLRSLKEVLSSWIQALVRILPWSTSSPATGWWVSQLAIGALGMLLLHVSVQSRIREIRLLAVLALEVPALIVVLGPSLADLPGAVLVLVLILGVLRVFSQIVLALVLILIVIHWVKLDLIFAKFMI